MKISLKSPTNARVDTPENGAQTLKDLLNDVIAEQGLQGSVVPSWNADGSLEASRIPSLLLHSYLLKAERLGLSYAMERKIIIHFETGE